MLVIPGRASALESAHGIQRAHTQAHPMYLGSRPSCGGNTPTPACLSAITGLSELQWCSLSCMSSHSQDPEEEEEATMTLSSV